MLNHEQRWQAVVERRAESFFYGVKTTGVFCKPSCGARLPRPQNVEFFETIAQAAAAGFRPCLRCHPVSADPAIQEIARLCRHIEQHCSETIRLDTLAVLRGQTASHVQRTFKAALGVSPREYADACRMRLFKQGLREQHSVIRAMVDAGYSSTSRLYERTNQAIGMTPVEYRSGAVNTTIRYAIAQTALGPVIVAVTDIGICSVQLADTCEELLALVVAEFPQAALREDTEGLAAWMAEVAAQLSGIQPSLDLPLDVRATAFQQRVWTYLRTIPAGTTQTYSEVARALDSPNAVRAVARACATNRVAVLIPCHRVVREGGTLAGYRWGIERKKKLIEQERAS